MSTSKQMKLKMRPEQNFGRTSLESYWNSVVAGWLGFGAGVWLYPSDLANCMTTGGGMRPPGH